MPKDDEAYMTGQLLAALAKLEARFDAQDERLATIEKAQEKSRDRGWHLIVAALIPTLTIAAAWGALHIRLSNAEERGQELRADAREVATHVENVDRVLGSFVARNDSWRDQVDQNSVRVRETAQQHDERLRKLEQRRQR